MTGVQTCALPILDFDLPTIRKWAVKYFSELRETVQANKPDPLANLGAFLNEHNRNLLVVDDANDKRTGLTRAPLEVPYGSLFVRYEPDTHLLWIAVDKFREWCTEHQIGFKGTVAALTKYDPESTIKKKGMAKGTMLNTPAINAIRINLRKVPIDISIPETNDSK